MVTELDLTGKSAVVTGGASGLGHATAEVLERAGAFVVVVDLPDAEGHSMHADAVARLGERAEFFPGDVTDPETAEQAVVKASEQGPLHVLVNCAGVATPAKLLSKHGPLALDEFLAVLRINTGGTVAMMAAAAEVMKDQPASSATADRGVIINTASVAAFDGQIGQMAYAASKGAVASMTLPAARELAQHRIRVNTIAPGLFETPLMAGLPEKARASLEETLLHPSRLGEPADYASLVGHIVVNPMLNGETIRLDGAVRLPPR